MERGIPTLIPINDRYAGLIKSALSKTGSVLLYDILKNATIRAEEILEKDGLPENLRIGVKYTHVLATKDYSYYYTLQRLQNGTWALTGFEQEAAQKQEVLICQ